MLAGTLDASLSGNLLTGTTGAGEGTIKEVEGTIRSSEGKTTTGHDS